MPPHMKVLRDSGYRALEELRRTGVVSAIGLGVNEKEVLIEVMQFGDWDVFLLAGRYTLLEQAPLDDLLPMCATRGTSIVVGGPLNSGILAGRDTWNYAAAPPEIVERVGAIRAVCDAHDVPLPAAALQFPLAHPAVAAIIPGPRAAEEFEENQELLRHPIPAALWTDLRDQNCCIRRRRYQASSRGQPLTAPSANPRTRCRCNAIMNTTIGSMMPTAAAADSDQ